MRAVVLTSVLGFILAAVSQPSFSQNILRTEPLALGPYEIAFVDDGSCSAGKVLKVTGAIRGLHRKKSCVRLGDERASLSVATH
jgi:hypothetical protein